jgi:hypothetical protein
MCAKIVCVSGGKQIIVAMLQEPPYCVHHDD